MIRYAHRFFLAMNMQPAEVLSLSNTHFFRGLFSPKNGDIQTFLLNQKIAFLLKKKFSYLFIGKQEVYWVKPNIIFIFVR